MSLQKISAATIIALSLAACSSGSDSPNSTLPNTNPTVTNPSNGSQTNNGNAAANNENNAASNGNTAANANNPANSGNTTANNPPPHVDFSVSYEGIKNTADKDIRELAEDKKIDGAVILKSYKVNLGNQSSSGNNFNLSSIPLKTLVSQNYRETVVAQAEGQNHTITRNGVAHIYRQNYSLIAGITPTGLTLNGESEKLDADDDDTNILIKGYTTQNLPTAGKFDYSGIASDGDKKGKLAYSVDFDSRKGSGKITGLDSDIHLNEAEIKKMSYTNKETDRTTINGHGIEGSSNRGSYRLGFFGPNAEEIVGTVDDRNNGEIGFAGSR
ncbi:MAG: transferrin-binding protein-like solute binding protein [Neisseria sp.]|nr:transferrin-binding protein-like solute binding protein [Neisseria sp.]